MKLFGFNLSKDKLSNEEKRLKEVIKYDPVRQEAVIRASICTGEKVAGFKDRKNGSFTEVMLIRNQEDEEHFKKIFEVQEIRVEY